MKTNPIIKLLLLGAAGTALSTGCVVRERVVYRQPAPVATQEVVVTEAPPAPVYEAVTIAPGPAFIWVGGAWAWRGHWIWERGHWVRPPRPGAVWRPHHYEYRNGVHVWVRGGWSY